MTAPITSTAFNYLGSDPVYVQHEVPQDRKSLEGTDTMQDSESDFPDGGFRAWLMLAGVRRRLG